MGEGESSHDQVSCKPALHDLPRAIVYTPTFVIYLLDLVKSCASLGVLEISRLAGESQRRGRSWDNAKCVSRPFRWYRGNAWTPDRNHYK